MSILVFQVLLGLLHQAPNFSSPLINSTWGFSVESTPVLSNGLLNGK